MKYLEGTLEGHYHFIERIFFLIAKALICCLISVGYHLEIRVAMNFYQLSYIIFINVDTIYLSYFVKKMIFLVKYFSYVELQMVTNTN